FLTSRRAFCLPPLKPGVESGSTDTIRNPSLGTRARSSSRIFFVFATPGERLLQFSWRYVELEQAVAAEHRERELRADRRLDHQPLQVAGLADAGPADRHDHVAAAQLSPSRGAARHDLVDLDAGLAAESLRDGRRQRPGAAGDPEVGPAHAAVAHQRG